MLFLLSPCYHLKCYFRLEDSHFIFNYSLFCFQFSISSIYSSLTTKFLIILSIICCMPLIILLTFYFSIASFTNYREFDSRQCIHTIKVLSIYYFFLIHGQNNVPIICRIFHPFTLFLLFISIFY